MASQDAPRASHSRSLLLLSLLGASLVLMPFLFWHQTWFGRSLTDQEVERYLHDNAHARKIQHALSQIADRIVQGDPSVKPWYPQIVRLARHPVTIIRSTCAWVMGQDSSSGAFHQALLDLLRDPEPIVRRNAALALVRFRDASGRAELVGMLEPFTVRAPAEGTLSIQSEAGRSVGSGALLARIRRSQGGEVEVRSPLSGQVDRILRGQGSRVVTGDAVASLGPEPDQVWEALRGLYLVGEPADLGDVERCEHAVTGTNNRLRQQAVLTAEAIRSRAERNPSR